MKRASISMALAVTVAAASFAPAAVAAPACKRCAGDVCCPKDTKRYCSQPKTKLTSNWTTDKPCCKVEVDRLNCQGMAPVH